MFKSLTIQASVVFAMLLCALPAQAQNTPFQFESISSLNDMRAMIRDRFQLGSPRAAVRATFVNEGHATLKPHPTQAGVEKYLYDINLCSYYVWRWNLSADFDANGKLLQIYVNGDIVFADGTPKRITSKAASPGKTASIYKVQRSRPEAVKGESSLAYILFDGDSNLSTRDDQTAMGAGPSRADPIDGGKLIVYLDVDPWRSIFDNDAADRIVPFAGNCSAVEQQNATSSRQLKK